MAAIASSFQTYVHAITAAIAIAVVECPTIAQTLTHAPLPRHVASPGASFTAIAPLLMFRPLPIGPHTFYGTVTSLRGNTIVIRTRRQRLLSVDATKVLANGNYSAPLFVGKLVTIDGEAANSVFTAEIFPG